MKKILIIEDDQIVANIYRNKFSIEGFQVEVANDGHLGLELVRSFRPDAVLLDLLIPKMTGVELMKEIRSEPDFEKLPVIVFSNTYLTNLVQDAWKAGATKCLSKSNCTPKQVIDVIRSELSINGSGLIPPASASRAAASAAATAKTAQSTTSDEADKEFQSNARNSFVEGMPATLSALRT